MTRTGSDSGRERLGETAARAERGPLGQPGADERELQDLDRAGVHGLGALASGAGDGRAVRVDEPPGLAAPRLGGVADADPRRRRDARGRLARLDAGAAERGSSRSTPVSARVMSNAAATRPGPAASRSPASAASRAVGRARGLGRRVRARRRARDPRRRASPPTPVDRLDGADQHGGGAALGLGDDVQALVHPVDKVHVGDPRRPEHDRVARRPAEAGVRGAVVLADVRLDLDDPPDAAGRARPPAVADEVRAEQRPRGVERRAGEELARERRARGGSAPRGSARSSREGVADVLREQEAEDARGSPGSRCRGGSSAVSVGSRKPCSVRRSAELAEPDRARWTSGWL